MLRSRNIHSQVEILYLRMPLPSLKSCGSMTKPQTTAATKNHLTLSLCASKKSSETTTWC